MQVHQQREEIANLQHELGSVRAEQGRMPPRPGPAPPISGLGHYAPDQYSQLPPLRGLQSGSAPPTHDSMAGIQFDAPRMNYRPEQQQQRL